MLVDSHCHLNYLDQPHQAIANARSCGVGTMLCIGVEEGTIAEVLQLAQGDPDIWASVGEHPGSATGDTRWVEPLLNHSKVVAVGEMGLDYHYEKNQQQQRLQRQSFEQQLILAAQADLPVIIHTRAAQDDTLQLLRAHPGVRGVLHCFTESWEMAEAALALGYFVSISGIVTFKQADNVREVAKRIPDHRLLIETDAPWLAPVPHRGQQNQPGFVADTANFLANLRGVSVEHLARQTSENFFALFSRAQVPTQEVQG